jgi:hypothetical protein
MGTGDHHSGWLENKAEYSDGMIFIISAWSFPRCEVEPGNSDPPRIEIESSIWMGAKVDFRSSPSLEPWGERGGVKEIE